MIPSVTIWASALHCIVMLYNLYLPLPTQQKGACLFHAFRKSTICPREFTNTHLRRMVVSFICQNLNFLYPMLRLSIAGNYGHLRLSRTQYEDLRDRNLLTPQQREEYLTYLENLLKPNFYGEEIVLRILSMLFQVRITVLNSESFIPTKIRHINKALKADVIFVHVDRHHYIPMGKLVLLIHVSCCSIFSVTAMHYNQCPVH